MSARRFTMLFGGALTGLLLVGIPAASQQASPAHQTTYPVQLTAPVAGLPPPAHPSRPPKEVPLHRPHAVCVGPKQLVTTALYTNSTLTPLGTHGYPPPTRVPAQPGNLLNPNLYRHRSNLTV